jgi:tetraacyldisaccharide 4'-kinase
VGRESVSADPRTRVVRWWRGGGGAAGRALSRALWPAEMLFRAGVSIRQTGYTRGWLAVERARIPVVSVGNLTVGGEGKTPLAAWIARELEIAGARPAIVMRGYGADEVLVHRELNPDIPVFTARRRVRGVERAADEGRNVAVLDDGFQHRRLHRDLDLVVLAAERYTRPPRLLPRGPWRENFSALHRADAVIVTRKCAGTEAAERLRDRVREMAPDSLLASCSLRISGIVEPGAPEPARRDVQWLERRQVLAVASVGDPEAFADQLRALGATVELMAYPDHHAFTPSDVAAIARRSDGRPLVVTLKDAVKLRRLVPNGTRLATMEQEVCFEQGEEELREMLRRTLIR